MAELPIGDDWKEGTEDSLSFVRNCFCVNCNGTNGTTTILPTKVPYFREIIVYHFKCNDCYYNNSEISFGGEIQVRGERITFHVTNVQDLNRQIIKSDSATIVLPQCYELEIPPTTQKGTISTIEGLLRTAANNLEALQPERLRLKDLDNFYRCKQVIEKLRVLAQVKDDDDDDEDVGDDEEEKTNEKELVFEEFDIIVDDPAGNSFIENIYAPNKDPNMTSIYYYRTPTQDMSLGLQPSANAIESGTIDDNNPLHKNVVNSAGPSIPTGSNAPFASTDTAGAGVAATSTGSTIEISPEILSRTTNIVSSNDADGDNADDVAGIGRKEVITFNTPCPHCYRTCETAMCLVDIPHFKEIIIMSLVCDKCGYKSNEVKGGGGIPQFGTEIIVSCTTPDDLAREVLKSDTAGIIIKELDLELSEGGLDGVYTTIEGLLQKLYKRLRAANPFSIGDSATKQHLSNDVGNEFSNPDPVYTKYIAFLSKLEEMSKGLLLPFTLIITDPLSNSFVGPIPADAIRLSYQAEKDGNNQCYIDYIDKGMIVNEFVRSHEQNEILGLNDMKTENYQEQQQHSQQQLDGTGNNSTRSTTTYYGTDRMEELPDRIRRIDVRGPDHPHPVGKAPVENDTTIMGPGSLNFAVPSIGQRGKTITTAPLSLQSQQQEQQQQQQLETVVSPLKQLIEENEKHDTTFVQSDQYNGSKQQFVFKHGVQGLGYYRDIPLLEQWETQNIETWKK